MAYAGPMPRKPPLPAPSPHQWTVYIDGSALPNPGRMRIGGIAHAPGGTTHRFSQPLPQTGCNNEAEARAAIYALQWLQALGARDVLLHTDNSILAEQLSQPDPKPIARLCHWYDSARQLLAGFDQVHVQWIPRHKNAVADALARGDGLDAVALVETGGR